jgi:hypothetical protein
MACGIRSLKVAVYRALTKVVPGYWETFWILEHHASLFSVKTLSKAQDRPAKCVVATFCLFLAGQEQRTCPVTTTVKPA